MASAHVDSIAFASTLVALDNPAASNFLSLINIKRLILIGSVREKKTTVALYKWPDPIISSSVASNFRSRASGEIASYSGASRARGVYHHLALRAWREGVAWA